MPTRNLANFCASRLMFFALGLESKIDHHDGVLLDDADQQDDSNQGHHGEIVMRDLQRKNCAHSGRRQRRKNCNGMDVALIQHAEHDVDGDHGGQNQKWFRRQRILECSRRPLKRRVNAGG